MVQGGFRSWVKDGLRSKELKAETALTFLNEVSDLYILHLIDRLILMTKTCIFQEAEAILKDIKPSPVQIIGYGLVNFILSLKSLDNMTTYKFNWFTLLTENMLSFI